MKFPIAFFFFALSRQSHALSDADLSLFFSGFGLRSLRCIARLTGNANAITVKTLAAPSALFSLLVRERKKERESERGRPVFQALNARNVAPAFREGDNISQGLS